MSTQKGAEQTFVCSAMREVAGISEGDAERDLVITERFT